MATPATSPLTAPLAAPAPEEPAAGLSSAEARRRLARHGPNEPTTARRASGLAQFLRFFANPLVLILLLATAVSAAVGEFVNAAIIAAIVLLSVLLGFAQTYRSARAADRLRAAVAPTATARRDGDWRQLPRREVVPGDVVRLAAGDLVPADARLLDARDLHVQEAALTGESLPVEKEAGTAGDDDRDRVFLGTSVVSGAATALVTATGPATAFGDIAARLATRPPETAFERGTRQFGYLIMRTVVFLVLFVFLVLVVFPIATNRPHDPLESLLFALALAVGLTPEFLPMIVTVTLTQGAVHMARRKVIVKHLEAIQNFGSIDVLCSDKTGTLTGGTMVLDRHLDPLGRPAERPLLLATLNAAFQTGIASPLDEAIARHAGAAGADRAAYRKLDEIPFDFERRRLSVVVAADGDAPDAPRLLISKGAPEGLLPRCAAYATPDGPAPLDAAARARCEATYRDLSAEGYRVLAVASRAVPPQAAYHAADERDLTLEGFVAFSDEPLADAPATLAALARDGVRVKILTGDNDLVARHVCAAVGLAGARIVLGPELDHISDAALGAVAERADVFARVSPAQKNRIILALKGRGHVVGFLGDGINDAPSLHAADVGISVAGAVDVAKDAADIILLERSLRVLHEGILEGRKAFGNVMKYLLMGTSSNFGNMFSMAGAALFLPFLPMLPTQILLNNFLYDLAQVTIPADTVDEAFVRQPRRWDIALIRDFMLRIGPLSSLYDFLTFVVLLGLFHAQPPLFHTGWFVESLATQTLVIFVIRTAGSPWRSRPSRPLVLTTLLVVAVGLALPFTPAATALGFVPLPPRFFLFLAGATATYLLLVEVAKRRLLRRLLA
ncbi:MAG TPA: magnesium-translocating P-type ATPase [Thermomicrobiales bacterium]|nr:magnesium-translocating P-type ATPase [Thermomicrobiales bacterium]